MYYNVRVKSFPDGMKQYMYSDRGKQKGYEVEKKEKTGQSVERKERENMSRAFMIWLVVMNLIGL